MKQIPIVTLLVLSAIFAQDSMGGYPYSFSNDLPNNIGVITTDEVDHEQMLEEDELRPINSPFRYGKIFEVDHNFFDYAKKENSSDFEFVESKGVKIFIEPKATMFLIGSEMDYMNDKLSSRFVFNNPNEKSSCGCGESFNI